MEYLLYVVDANSRHMMVLTLSQADVRKSAIDVVFDFLGNEHPEELIARGVLPEGQLEDFRTLQSVLFDRDAQGLFIRDGISLQANGSDLNPDATMDGAFLAATRDGVDYKRCDLALNNGEGMAPSPSHGSMEELGRLMFLHQIAIGKLIDVTNEPAELSDTIAWAEKDGLIEIDVQKAAYKLTEKGKRRHDSYREEAQNLIIRYDIFADVDIDSQGQVFFDTKLGRDLRVPVYEIEGIDPYRARFVLGLNDGEWDKMDDWIEVSSDESWYREIFAPIDTAPSVDDIGRGKLEHIVEAGKARLRQESL